MHLVCPKTLGTYADPTSRKCVLYCPLGYFADPTTQVCVPSNFHSIQPVLLFQIISAAISRETACFNATEASLPTQRPGNAFKSVLLVFTETTQLVDACRAAQNHKEPTLIRLPISAWPSALPIITQMIQQEYACRPCTAATTLLVILSCRNVCSQTVFCFLFRVFNWTLCGY